MESKFDGVISALPTPFKDGVVDKGSLKKLIKFQLDNGIDGFVVSGTTGESPTLSKKEVEDLYHLVRSESGGQVPILVGTGSNSTETTIDNSVKAETWGADGLLVVTPYYNKPPQRGLVAHFKAVAQSVDIPVVLYNVPGRTAVSMTADTVIELSKVPNIIGVKEATGDLELGKKIIEGTGEDFVVTSGDDDTFLALALLGGQGVISVLSNVCPRQTKDLFVRARKGDKESVRDFEKLREITRLLFVEANPIPVKAALHLMGIFETNEMRLPLVSLDPKHAPALEAELKKVGVHK